jgi:hypothetical protein
MWGLVMWGQPPSAVRPSEARLAQKQRCHSDTRRRRRSEEEPAAPAVILSRASARRGTLRQRAARPYQTGISIADRETHTRPGQTGSSTTDGEGHTRPGRARLQSCRYDASKRCGFSRLGILLPNRGCPILVAFFATRVGATLTHNPCPRILCP